MAYDEKWKQFFRARRQSLEDKALVREIPPVDQGACLHLEYGGQRLLNLASNNYLGWAGRRELARGAAKAAKRHGTGSGASRLVTGNYALLDELDAEAALFKGCEDAVTFGSGFAANMCAITVLADRSTVVFSDRLNHASIVDGIRLSGARHVRYRHNDLDHLGALMRKNAGQGRMLVVTDSVFSMDGDVADLEGLVRLCRDHGALLMVDDAHGTGVLGKGRGLAHELGLAHEVDVHMSTFSKALGSYGGFIASSAEIIDQVRNFGRPFIFSTAVPPAVAGANLVALDMIGEMRIKGPKLVEDCAVLREWLQGLGFETGDSQTQIIPIMMGSNDKALFAKEFLVGQGVYCAAIRPPTVPEGSARLRLSLRADMSKDDYRLLREAFTALASEVCS